MIFHVAALTTITQRDKPKVAFRVKSEFLSSASTLIAAINNIVPIARPFFPPRKRLLTGNADFLWEVVLLNRLAFIILHF